jgi:hypothetical protein
MLYFWTSQLSSNTKQAAGIMADLASRVVAE